MKNIELTDKVRSSDSEQGTDGFNSRLIELSKKYDSQTSFAAASGVSVSGIQRLLAGGTPRLPILVSIAKGNGVNIEWLATGEGPKYIDDTNQPYQPVFNTMGSSIDLAEFVFIPRYNISASAGYGCDVSQENYMHSMAFRKYWIDNVLGVCAKDLIVIGVKGDSMEGEISDGDIILINTADKHLNNGIYVIRIDGDLIVKHIQKLPGNKIRVSSTNKIYDPFDIDLNNQPNDFGAIGRVVWHGRNVP